MNFNFFKKHKYLIIISLFFLFMLPSTLSQPSQTDTRAIATGISIDKKEDKFNIAIQLITPQSNLSNNENIDIVEDEGDTFFECLHNLSVKLGKVVGLEHTNIIIIGEGVKDEDLMNIFDFLYRNSKITLATIVLQSDGDAKSLLETSAELNNNSSSSLQNNLSFNDAIIETSNATSIGKFYNDYFSFSKTSLVPLIEGHDKEESSSDGESSSGGNQGSSGGEQQQSGSGGESGKAKVEPLIKNNGESAVYKNGKFVTKLSKELTNGFSWLDTRTIKGVVKVENVTDEKYFNNSTVNVQIEEAKIKVNPIIKNNKLIFKADLEIRCYVSEIVSDNIKSLKLMQSDETYLTKVLKEKITEKITSQVQKSLSFSKTNKLDIFNFYDKFYKYNKNGLRKILNIYGEDYLDATEIDLNIKIYPYK